VLCVSLTSHAAFYPDEGNVRVANTFLMRCIRRRMRYWFDVLDGIDSSINHYHFSAFLISVATLVCILSYLMIEAKDKDCRE